MNKKLPKNKLIPIPPMTKEWGQITCELELRRKGGVFKTLYLSVPEFKKGNPTYTTYLIDCNSPRFELVSNTHESITSAHILWCEEHKTMCYRFNFPVGTRFIDCSSLFSSIYINLKFVLALPKDLNAEEKRVRMLSNLPHPSQGADHVRRNLYP